MIYEVYSRDSKSNFPRQDHPVWGLGKKKNGRGRIASCLRLCIFKFFAGKAPSGIPQLRFISATALATILVLSVFPLEAQNKILKAGSITGKIIDSRSKTPIEYATISLITLSGGKIVNGVISDTSCIFILARVAEGNYKVVIDFLGYKEYVKDHMVIGKGNTPVDLGIIELTTNQTLLKDVTITSDKEIIENKIDKTIYNVDRDITSQYGVATDVLRKVPQVSVDVDGNVELQGSSSVRFLINGRPSVLFGNNIAEVLQSIPASRIQSIEVITIPGARYDAAGTGGIINIILKKNTEEGTNGNLSLSAGTRLENGSLNLNLRKKNFGVNAFFSGNAQLSSATQDDLDRLSQDSLTTTRLIQHGKSNFSRHGFETGIGFDWDLTSKANLEGTLGYDHFGNHASGGAGREFVVKDGAGITLSDLHDSMLTDNIFHERSLETQLGYKKKFKKEDQEFEMIYNSSLGHNYSYYEQKQENLNPESLARGSYGNNPGIENETTMEINYTDPLTEKVKIETGAKTEYDYIHSVSDVYLLNTPTDNFEYSTDQSSRLDFKRHIYAGYLSFTFKLSKNFAIQSGARYEYTTSKADFSNSGMINFHHYHTLVPSLVFMHNFGKEQTLKLSYTRRIERPDYGDLNPFINASDPQNLYTGNPNLKPEIGDRAEASYNQTFARDGNFSVTLFAGKNSNDIQPYWRFYPSFAIGDSTYTNVTIRIRENIGHEDNYGLNLFASVPLTNSFSVRTNIQLFQRYIFSGISSVANVHGFNYRANLNATYKVSRTLAFEFFGNFRSRLINAQGTRPGFTTYNLAFRKEFLHNRASIAATATNFLDENVKQETNLKGDNFTMKDIRRIPYRSFGINFTYKFGAFKKGKEPEDINLTNPPEN